MAEALAHNGAPQAHEGSERFRLMYLGLLNTVNERLGEIPEDARDQIEFVSFSLNDRTTSLTGVTVGRRNHEGVLPVTFVEGTYKESIGLRPDGSLEGPDPDSSMFAVFAADLERRLDSLEGAPATATIIREIPL
ncbi:MAG TPA: hypothetical protein VHA05_02370 [Candidatus Saccharimonadales bacterium]|nr:hypothetical protein [Candidatus Saccharimonadales bacterium]